MTTSTTPIHTRFRIIDGLRIRFAESEPRDQHALLLNHGPRRCLRSHRCGAALGERAPGGG
jgi:hypothetical protein